MKQKVLKEVFSWIGVILGGFAAALLIQQFVIVNANVPSGSMLDTIQIESRIVALRLSYLFSRPERFDVVVFQYPDDESKLYVKRIIGMPGDTVEIRGGSVFIDGEELSEEYTRGSTYGSSGEYVVPVGSYFMLGDNRTNSEDSRIWNNTYVEEGKILGKVMFSYYPSFKAIN